MRKVLEKCPSCNGKLAVTRMSCTACETVILSRYEPCLFCSLAPDSMHFLKVFIKNRGNVKDMERELKQSYWTIRTKINDLIEALGFEVPQVEEEVKEAIKQGRKEILEQLRQGKITAADATKLLAKL